jgi:ABC-type branched-subunit amino acid transport system permease subunit
LRSVELAGFLFYGGAVIGLIGWLKPSRQLISVLGGVVIGAILLKLLVNLIWPGFDVGRAPAAGSFLNQWVQSVLVIPVDFQTIGNIVIGLAILSLLLTVLLKGWGRLVLLGLTLYLFAFAWETRLATEPAVTRILVVGMTLVVLMITRPQGLLGKLRVEIG